MTPESPCAYCARLHRRSFPPTCSAFPDGIPDAIWLHGDPHFTPYPGDHDLQFTPAADAPDAVKRTGHPFPPASEASKTA